MPELPEVETVARGLRRTIVGRRIVSVRLGKTDFIDDPAALELHLPGRQIEAVERYGKFMLLRLSHVSQSTSPIAIGDGDPAALLVHLGMTGQIAPSPAPQPCEKHTDACFVLDDGRELRYTDARRFGRLAYLQAAALEEELRAFGADPLQINAEEFVTQTRSRRARIKALLLDQSFLRGVGNIYADESLWRGIRFDRTGNPQCTDDCFSRLTAPFTSSSFQKGADIPYNQSIDTGLSSAYYSVDAVVPQPRLGVVWSPRGGGNAMVIRAGFRPLSPTWRRPSWCRTCIGNAPYPFGAYVNEGQEVGLASDRTAPPPPPRMSSTPSRPDSSMAPHWLS